MHQLVKLTDALWLFTACNLFLSHSCIWVTRVKTPPGFEPRSPDWEADDLPTELSLPPWIKNNNTACVYFNIIIKTEKDLKDISVF